METLDPGATEYKGLLITIEYDAYPLGSPRDGGNLGTMACWHTRHTLGDVMPGGVPSEYYEATIEPAEKAGGIVLPLFLKDHSDLRMQTRAFSCPWDSGQVGWIYVSAEGIRKEYGVERIDASVREHALTALRNEVSVYDQHLAGDVYVYVVENADREFVSSCSNLYGFAHAAKEAMHEADQYLKSLRPSESELVVEVNRCCERVVLSAARSTMFMSPEQARSVAQALMGYASDVEFVKHKDSALSTTRVSLRDSSPSKG